MILKPFWKCPREKDCVWWLSPKKLLILGLGHLLFLFLGMMLCGASCKMAIVYLLKILDLVLISAHHDLSHLPVVNTKCSLPRKLMPSAYSLCWQQPLIQGNSPQTQFNLYMVSTYKSLKWNVWILILSPWFNVGIISQKSMHCIDGNQI